MTTGVARELGPSSNRFDIQAPHFVLNRVREEIITRFGERALFEDGLEIFTTLDLELQHMAEEILERQLAERHVAIRSRVRGNLMSISRESPRK